MRWKKGEKKEKVPLSPYGERSYYRADKPGDTRAQKNPEYRFLERRRPRRERRELINRQIRGRNRRYLRERERKRRKSSGRASEPLSTREDTANCGGRGGVHRWKFRRWRVFFSTGQGWGIVGLDLIREKKRER